MEDADHKMPKERLEAIETEISKLGLTLEASAGVTEMPSNMHGWRTSAPRSPGSPLALVCRPRTP